MAGDLLPPTAFEVVQGPSARDYQAPQLGSQLLDVFARGQQDAFQQQENQRTLAIQNAFKNGVQTITTPDGQQVVDINSVMQTLAKAGATDQIVPLANAALGQQQFLYDRGSAPLIGGRTGSPSNYAGPLLGMTQPGGANNTVDGAPTAPAPMPQPVSNPSAAGPANIRGPAQPAQPGLSSVGADDQGADSLRSIVAEHFGGRDVSALIPRFGAAFGVDPDQPLTQQQATALRTRVAQTAASMGPANQNGQNAAPPPMSGASGAPAPAGTLTTGAPPTAAPASDDASYLQAHGIVPNSRSLAAAQLFGAPAAANFISGISRNPNATAVSLFDPSVVKADPSLFYDQSGKPVSAAQLFRNLGQPQPNAAPNTPVTPSLAVRNADPTLGGLVPADYPGGAPQYLNDLYLRAGGPMGDKMRQLYEDRIKTVQDALAKTGELTPGMREWVVGRQPGETQAAYEARAAGAKEAAVAPYQIAAAAIREGGRPVTIAPNQVVTTGATVNPELQRITDWASQRLGMPSTQGAAPPLPPASAGAPASPLPAGSQTPNATTGAQSAFTPQMIRNPDGSVTSSVTPGLEGIQKAAAENYEKAHQTYAAAQQTKQTLALMEDSFRTLNQTGWSSTGAGAEARLGLAKAVNSVWQVLGVQGQDLPFNPDTIASWEDLTKNSTRLGFALARTLGAREAMQIVAGAIKANPSMENTPAGARMVLNAIRQNAERDSDYYEYATQYAQSHGGDLVGAEVAFNKANPPSLYARRAIVQAQRNIPQEAVDALRANPKLGQQFDQKYGADGLAKTFLPQAVQ